MRINNKYNYYEILEKIVENIVTRYNYFSSTYSKYVLMRLDIKKLL